MSAEVFLPLNPVEILNLYRQNVLPGVIKRRYVEKLDLSDVLKPIRPYFKAVDSEDDKYVALARLMTFSSCKGFGVDDVVAAYLFHAGRNLGKEMYWKGLVKTIDDLFRAFLKYKVGLVDIVKESEDVVVIDVYECILCSGLPVINKPVCYFEAGVLSAIFEKLVGANTVKEEKCWCLGDLKCRFKVEFF